MSGCFVVFLCILWLTVDAPSETQRCNCNFLTILNYYSTTTVTNISHCSFTSTQAKFKSYFTNTEGTNAMLKSDL